MTDSNNNLNIPTYSSSINKRKYDFKRGLEITTGVKKHVHGY